jgi:hypothetical protein
MDVNYEGNRLNDVKSTERVCVCVCVCVFKMLSVFKELLDLRRSSTKPAALLLLNAVQNTQSVEAYRLAFPCSRKY